MTVLVLIAVFSIRPRESRIDTTLFCAYNRVFVEFEEDGHKWGTLMLDTIGRPIPCDEDVLPIEKTI